MAATDGARLRHRRPDPEFIRVSPPLASCSRLELLLAYLALATPLAWWHTQTSPGIEYRESMPTTYELHGLRVCSEVPLAERVAAHGGHDVDVRWGDQVAIPASPPTGRILALRDPDVGGCTIVRTPIGHVIRFSNECDFRIAADGRSIVVDIAPGFDRRLVSILLTGNVLASLLGLRGECVLHASAVRRDGWTLAILGASGIGKSTLAAVFCASGAELVSDDVLRIESNGNPPRCFTGTAQLRLRPNAAELADLFPPEARETTADGRIGLTPTQAKAGTFELDAVVIPRPAPRSRTLRVHRLPQMAALVSLLSFPRVLGWQDSSPIRRHFNVCADMAERVPILKATIPWGPPFSPDLADALADQLQGSVCLPGA